MLKEYKCPLAFRRATLEDAYKYNPIVRRGVLYAEVKSYTDWSDPKWRMGDGKTRYLDLPYCSGPPSVVIEMANPMEFDPLQEEENICKDKT